MCFGLEAATIGLIIGGASLVTGIAGTVTAAVGAAQQANQQNAYQVALARNRNEQIAQQNKLIIAEHNRAQDQLGLELQQKRVATAQEKFDNSIAAREAAATAQVAAGEAGLNTSNLEGGSVNRLIDDYYRQLAVQNDRAQEELEFTELQAQNKGESLTERSANQIASGAPFVPNFQQGPSFLGTALQVGTQALGGSFQLGVNSGHFGRGPASNA